MMDRRVIFVGGASYSGTTLLDLMLASGPGVFSVGELGDLFHPSKPHHINSACGCGDTNCALWREIRSEGSDHVYERLFQRYPEVRCIVDSTKDVLWIKEQSKRLTGKGIHTRNVLIWKTPLEFAASMVKRGITEDWEREWRSYHRLYFSLIERPVSAKYSSLAANPAATLRTICQAIGLPYFQGKEDYWNYKHHSLFGSPSAKIHLYAKDSDAYKSSSGELQSIFKNQELAISVDANYRSIYYQNHVEEKLPLRVVTKATIDPGLNLMLKLLEATGAGLPIDDEQINDLVNLVKYDKPMTWIRKEIALLKRTRGEMLANIKYHSTPGHELEIRTPGKIRTV
jgi:hypothetical protein